MRISLPFRVKRDATAPVGELAHVMVTWLEQQGDLRYELTRTFDDQGDALRFAASLDRPADCREIRA